jgi:hypothetical protein
MHGPNTGTSAAREKRGQNICPGENGGPILSERQWGTVREDYSKNGDVWGYFSHDQSRSRAYRWGETESRALR